MNPLKDPSNAKAAGCPCLSQKNKDDIKAMEASGVLGNKPLCPTGYLFDPATQQCVLSR